MSKQTARSNKRAAIWHSQEASLEIADKGLTGEAADNFRAYLSILHEWDAKDKLKSNVRED